MRHKTSQKHGTRHPCFKISIEAIFVYAHQYFWNYPREALTAWSPKFGKKFRAEAGGTCQKVGIRSAGPSEVGDGSDLTTLTLFKLSTALECRVADFSRNQGLENPNRECLEKAKSLGA
jgi:hypothetical protein